MRLKMRFTCVDFTHRRNILKKNCHLIYSSYVTLNRQGKNDNYNAY